VREAIAELMQLAVAGALRVTVDRCFPLDDAPAAYEYLRERRNIGKVLIKP
jgi:NADPH2:quinone reductase